ncbi:MAG: 16S rRNA (cytidine(1402)-2'-O)-methyltransferase [Actinobacteria bacterium]|nr:16S rRNA (cytidine(1402)-2'-O)-methyltransferase [Actinomycetota bacterium]
MSRLVLVATPIGNMSDASPRAIKELTAAGLVCCEDTRRTGVMLKNLGIDATLMRVDEHTEHASIPRVIDALDEGRDVCLVTDAGTPGISDPGERLVRAVSLTSHVVTAVPGPAALVMALVISGLPSGRFVFDGFLPRGGPERQRSIADLARERRTTVLYEAPHRLNRTLDDLFVTLGGQRRIVVTREMTKIHEEVWRGTLADAVTHFAGIEPKGEFVLVVDGASDEPAASADDIDRMLLAELAAGVSVRDATSVVTELTGASKKVVYNRALELSESDDNRT